jgi:hypothetical protein
MGASQYERPAQIFGDIYALAWNLDTSCLDKNSFFICIVHEDYMDYGKIDFPNSMMRGRMYLDITHIKWRRRRSQQAPAIRSVNCFQRFPVW